MDTGLLNLEEHFNTTYYVCDDRDDQSRSSLEDRPLFNWDVERELNGDIATIPSFGEPLRGLPDLTEPPSMLFQKMLEWSVYNAEGMDPFRNVEINNPSGEVDTKDILNTFDIDDGNFNFENFDLDCYLNETSPAIQTSPSHIQNVPKRQVKSAGKKIDMKACKYIIDDASESIDTIEKTDTSDDVDIETISEGTSLPVLEATDAFSLLEQFEASEKPFSAIKTEKLDETFDFSSMINLEMAVPAIASSPIDIFDKVPPTEIFEDIIDIKEEVLNYDVECDNVVEVTQGKKEFSYSILIPKKEELPVSMVTPIKKESPGSMVTSIKKESPVSMVTPVKKESPVSVATPIKKESPVRVATPIKKESPVSMVTSIKKESPVNVMPLKKEKSSVNIATPVKKESSMNISTKKRKEFPAVKMEVVAIKAETALPKLQMSEPSTPQNFRKTKQILDALPQELIARINESGKRKPITVIPPIPNRKRTAARSVDTISQHRNKVTKTSNDRIIYDHDYCAAPTPYPKEPCKDSGFQSEEDDRSVIRNQPTVKTADGKLMVSLLKVNTIRNNNSSQKKKLNLEEYKKRRSINSNTSQSNSPISSTCSSPLPEDENSKRLKHQEKLMKMAADLLNTPAKSSHPHIPVPGPKPARLPHKTRKPVPIPKKIVPPPDLIVKSCVSIGTNTDISSINTSKSIIASARQLEEIKPLLKKNSDKINSNSFITSLIENIPKAKTQISTYVKSENQEVVREDKVISYLEKDRVPAKTTSAWTQTDFEVIVIEDDTESRYRRRIDGRRSACSSLSGRSTRSGRHRRRSSSHSSRSSRSSDSSSSSSSSSSRSRSRSRSSSSQRPRHHNSDPLSEEEERRILYVGRIAKGTTKEDLKRRFDRFGPITTVSLHFRDYRDNYGFVTYAQKDDANEALEHGNDHAHPKYDLSFGGRRAFCKTTYSDLDNMRDDDYTYYQHRPTENSFDSLLRAAKETMRKRKP